MKKRALIFGVGGQDGSYLAEYLLKLDYEVHGIYRRTASGDPWRNLFHAKHMKLAGPHLSVGDLLDSHSIGCHLVALRPDEVYNMADQDHVATSCKSPMFSATITCNAVMGLLCAIQDCCPQARVFQPLSVTMFGQPLLYPQNVDTSLDPRSPYAAAKAGAWQWVKLFRNKGLYVSSAIFGTHNSPRQKPEYLLHEIAQGVVRILNDPSNPTISLGHLDQKVDIGHPLEYMAAAHKILQQERASDFCIGSGKPFSIREILNHALHVAGLTLKAEDVWAKGPHYKEGPQTPLIPDIRRARSELPFHPTCTALTGVEELVEHYMARDYKEQM